MPSHKCIAWCVLWAGEITSSYFFDDEVGNAVTVNDVRYSSMLTDFFLTKATI